MGTPRIAYDSMLRLPTISVTDPGSEPGYPIERLWNLKTYEPWRSNGVTAPINIDIDSGAGIESANYLGIASHNLASNGIDISVLNGPTFPPALTRLAPTVPTSDVASLFTWSAPSSRYWRIVIGASYGSPLPAVPEIGEAFLGVISTFDERLSAEVDPYFSSARVRAQRQSGGHALSMDSRRRHRGRISLGAAGATRSKWTSFLNNHALKRWPFFFVVDLDDSRFAQPAFVKLSDDEDAFRIAVGGKFDRLTFDLDVEEAQAEAA